MRERPELWRGAERIQWGCALMSLLGEASLEHLPLVLSGHRSVEGSRQVAPYRVAVRTARVVLGELLTRRAVQSAIFDYLSSESPHAYEIDPTTLAFHPKSAYDASIAEAQEVLRKGLPNRVRSQALADTRRDLVVRLSEEASVPIRLDGLTFPRPEQHDLRRVPNGPITVCWRDLQDLAAELDADDVRCGRKADNWVVRLAAAELFTTSGAGLRRTDELRLDQLVHLIGLPGSAKTTLIMLLCVLLSRRGQRLAVFFTAIEVARSYLETLSKYDVSTALLVGRSTDTHMVHAGRLAELVAASGQGGFGHTRPGVELLAQSCALPGFASAWPDEWEFGIAPCEAIHEGRDKVGKLCPAWSLCGRVKNQRELVNASVWLGHILSADTNVPAHTCAEQIRYFQLAARTRDLIVLDEVDDAQRTLDDHGALTLKLTGDDQSVHIDLQRTAGLLAANRAPISDQVLRYILRANEFERHTLRFVAEIRQLQRVQPRLARYYAEKLLTAGFLLREAIKEGRREDALGPQGHGALSDLWETAMYAAFFERDQDEGEWRRAQRYAPELGLTPEQGTAAWRRVNRALRRYLALDHAAGAEAPLADLLAVLTELLHAGAGANLAPHVRLLVAVGFTIASYQRLAKDARSLARRGEIPGGDLVFSRASEEIREIVPRSILGTFSSVRFRRVAGKEAFEIDYLVMDSTPRLLLHRLHENGANVLLTSATSWLEGSSEFHVGHPPSYVLQPKQPLAGGVRMYYTPKPHPVTGKPLRFSGGGYDRDDHLRFMVAALAKHGASTSSEIERLVRAIQTPLGRPRKVALVVNSYDQVRLVLDEIYAVNGSLGERTRGVVRELPQDGTRLRYVLRGQAESLGPDPGVDVVVFPLGALGRGTNVVFDTDDADKGRAAIGSVFFLTRPHPAAGDLNLMISLLAQATESLDRTDLSSMPLAAVADVVDQRRYDGYRRVARLLARPMSASMLDKDTLPVFGANLVVPVLQTIGRAMRLGMPAEVYFVDAAWAPNSAENRPETRRSSVLVTMREALESCLASRHPDQRDIYRALYGTFAEAFRDIGGVQFPYADGHDEPAEDFDPSPTGLEDAMDDWEPEAAGLPTTNDSELEAEPDDDEA